MNRSFRSVIVIPCYNEKSKLKVDNYLLFLSKHDDVLIHFVNDGSNDGTLEVLSDIKNQYPLKVEVFSYEKNAGKAEAVRRGMQNCNQKYNADFTAYLDADLAVSLDECNDMTKYCTKEIIYVFGSRIAKIGSIIQRKRSRFLIGRFIATLISMILSLKVYDTQCGCKVFTQELSKKIFKEEFISKWLFDVEIFFRIIDRVGRDKCLNVMLEVPLVRWVDEGESKVKYSYMFKMFVDLYRIKKAYKSI